MRLDGSLGKCITACGRDAVIATTLECHACYRRRRNRGLPPVVIEGHTKRKHDYDQKPYAPLTRGRTSKASRDLIQEGRQAFLADSHYLVTLVEDAQKVKNGLKITTIGRWVQDKESK